MAIGRPGTPGAPSDPGTRAPSHPQDRQDRSAGGAVRLRARATDPDEAEEIVTRHYLPNRLHLSSSTSLAMELSGLQVGAMTTGRLSYGDEVRLLTEAAREFHVNMPVRGSTVSRSGRSASVLATVGRPLVFSPEEPADIVWSPDSVQLCLMVPRAVLEAELERLLGRPVRSRLRFDFGVARAPGVERLQLMLGLVAQEIEHPSGLATDRIAARHLEGLVLDGLLVGQSHNYSDDALGSAGRAPAGVVRRGVELIEDRPGEPWTTVGLAAELHLSVRGLQVGFKREVGMAPMAYLRTVRLRRAHAALKAADPALTTVRSVAVRLGLLHQGRFALTYRESFGETPSQTLHR